MTALTASLPWRSHWSAPTFAGKKIVLAGRTSKWDKDRLVRFIKEEQGQVVEQATADVHIVVNLSGSATPASKKAEQLNKKSNASIEILTREEFDQRVAPSSSEVIEMLRAGQASAERWSQLWPTGSAEVDLTAADLRGAQLTGLDLEATTLDGADLRKATITNVNFGRLANVRFDGAKLTNCQWEALDDCSFVAAELTELEVGGMYSSGVAKLNGDFTRAKLVKSALTECKTPESKFIKTDLSETVFAAVDASGADFSGATLRGVIARESKFNECVFAKADLTGMDAAGSKFKSADLRGAKLRQANFSGADLSDAEFDGADVQDANFYNAKLSPKQLAKAKGKPRVIPEFAPAARFAELEAVPKKAGAYWANFFVTFNDVVYACSLTSNRGTGAKAVAIEVIRELGDDREDPPELTLNAAKYRDAFRDLIGYFGGVPTIRYDEVNVSNKKLLDPVCAGICAAFGVTAPTAAERKVLEKEEKAKKAVLKQTLLEELNAGPQGVKKWNARRLEDFQPLDRFAKADLQRARLDGLKIDGDILKFRVGRDVERFEFNEAKFNGASLKDVHFNNADFDESCFDGATIKGGKINASFSGASFDQATLEGVDFTDSYFDDAHFGRATIKRCVFNEAVLSGADFSQATIEGCTWKEATYDNSTEFPAGFTHTPEMDWCGDGPPPHELAVELAEADAALAELSKTAAGSPQELAARRAKRSSDYMQRLRKVVDSSKIDKAVKMLKADKFELFVETFDEHLVGVVKSQSDPDLVYACRLASNGSFCCCTQNLNVCGGLQGALCKHLLVLAIGLERTDRVEPEKLGLWAAASRGRKPELDKESMGEVLLRYKGAQAGELDWRPTETTPEDFYAF